MKVTSETIQAVVDALRVTHQDDMTTRTILDWVENAVCDYLRREKAEEAASDMWEKLTRGWYGSPSWQGLDPNVRNNLLDALVAAIASFDDEDDQ